MVKIACSAKSIYIKGAGIEVTSAKSTCTGGAGVTFLGATRIGNTCIRDICFGDACTRPSTYFRDVKIEGISITYATNVGGIDDIDIPKNLEIYLQ